MNQGETFFLTLFLIVITYVSMVDKKNILVVDNTTALVSPWKTDLKIYFTLLEVVGGFEALSKLKTNEICCVIVNLSIRSFNGLDVVLKIRDKYKSIPLVVIAEKTDLRFVKNAAMYGIHGYFLFPIDISKFLDTIAKITNVSLAQLINQMDTERIQQEQHAEQEEKEKENGDEDIPTLYYRGQSFLLHEDIDSAVDVFNKILKTKKLKDTWRKYREDSLYQIGRCFIKKGQYKDAIVKFNDFVSIAPNSEFHKNAFLLIGECYENLNDSNRAVAVYRKIVNMPPFDSVTTQARKKIKNLEK